MKAIPHRKRIRLAVSALLLAFGANAALAADDDEIDAETTIRLMGTAEAASSFVVTRDIALPDNASVELPARGRSASGDDEDRGNRDRNDREDRGDRGRSRADEARDNARDMSDDARDNRENRGRSGDRPGRPDRPDRPDPPKGPPGN